MIYQVVRHLHWLKIVVFVSTAFLAGPVAVVWGRFGFMGGMDDAVLWANLYMIAMLTWRFGPRCTVFEATLPIRPRDILCGQIVSAALLILLPVLAAAAFLGADTAKDHRTGAVLLEIAAILMVWVIAMNSIRLRRMSSPGLWREIALTVGAIGLIVFVLIMSKRHFVAPEVFGACVAGSAALLLRIWRKAPQTFEIADRKAGAAKGHRWRLIPSFTWLPVLRTLFDWKSVMFVFVIAVFCSTGQVLFAFLFLALAFIEVVPPSKWVWSLPIPRMKLFLSVVLSRLAPFFLAVLVCLLVARAPVRVIVVVAAAMAIIGVLMVPCAGSVFAAASRQRSVAGRMICAAVFMAPFLAAIIAAIMIQPPRQLQIAMRVSAALPGSLGMLIAASAAMVGGLGWISYKVFCRMEPRRVPFPSKVSWQ